MKLNEVFDIINKADYKSPTIIHNGVLKRGSEIDTINILEGGSLKMTRDGINITNSSIAGPMVFGNGSVIGGDVVNSTINSKYNQSSIQPSGKIVASKINLQDVLICNVPCTIEYIQR